MDEDIRAYIDKNKFAWEAAAKKRFWKNACLSLLALLWAFLALFTEYGSLMSFAILLALFVKFVLEPWSIKGIRKYKNHNDELD
jgi:hypothetical protein